MAGVMLLDGNSLAYRAFFALPGDLTTASGQVTNAVVGFTSMLLNLVRDHRPDGIVVAFDRREPTFRHEVVPEYKANRESAPDILHQQIGLIREILEVLGVPTAEVAGFEADDVIASLASQAAGRGEDVLIVTGDRDSFQLVADPHVKVLYNRRGVSDYALYDEAGIRERTGVSPEQYVEYAALRGDPSDNLAGVPGVGEKTAAKLISSYGGLDGVFAHLDEVSPKLRESLAAHEAQARRNAEVMTLVRDLELGVAPEPLSVDRIEPDATRKLFEFLELRNLLRRLEEVLGQGLGEASTAEESTLEFEVTLLDSVAEALDLLAGLKRGAAPLAVEAAWAGDEGRSPLAGLALVDGDADRSAAWLPTGLLGDDSVTEALGEIFGPDGRDVAMHSAKSAIKALRGLGADLRSLRLDTMIAAYLLDPAEGRYRLEDLATRYCGLALQGGGSAEQEGRLDLEGPGTREVAGLAAERAVAVSRLVGPIREALEAQGLLQLNDEVEVPLVRVLARMEEVGVGVDVAVLTDLNRRLATEATDLARRIQEDAGRDFNVNSTTQLREVLFDDLGLAPQKKTKTGFSTDAASLERLLGQHPIIEHLLRYREVEKLRSTYGEGLLAEVAADGRIHATFNQTVARTGRLSSDAPNLHNIPVRTEEGREFRRAFVPAPGYELLVADYDQIELRIIAHLAEDPGLIEAFESGQDVHRAVAARVFGVEPAAVTFEQRSRAKMVSYGLAYGMEAYGLAQRLAIGTDEAAAILDAYFAAFPAVHAYMESAVAQARERGYTETLFGRRRHIPELASTNFRIRQAGERQAMNAATQGLAADIFKVALVRLDAELEARERSARLVLQVHDEVLVEVRPEARDEVSALTVETMVNAFELRVPLAVDLAFGMSWAEAKP